MEVFFDHSTLTARIFQNVSQSGPDAPVTHVQSMALNYLINLEIPKYFIQNVLIKGLPFSLKTTSVH